MKFVKHVKMLPVLNTVKAILFFVMVLMFINFNAEVARQSAQTKTIATNTNQLVKKQDDILTAIKQVTDDTHTTAAQQTAIIICMLQVPIAQRTLDLQAQCRSSVGGTGSYSPSRSTQNSSASSNPTPTSTPTPTPSPTLNAAPIAVPSSQPLSTAAPEPRSTSFFDDLGSFLAKLVNK